MHIQITLVSSHKMPMSSSSKGETTAPFGNQCYLPVSVGASFWDLDAASDAGNWAAVKITADALLANSSVASALSGRASTAGNGAGLWACQSTALASSSHARELGRSAGGLDRGGLVLAATRLNEGSGRR